MNPEIETLLNECNPQELVECKTHIESLMSAQKEEKMKALLEEMRTWGITARDIIGENVGKNLSPKYRNPENPEQTWVGRGKPPDWFKTNLEEGITKEEMLIS
jgi:DNA-binding protein H-NS